MFSKTKSVCFILLILPQIIKSQVTFIDSNQNKPLESISLLFGGDLMGHGPQIRAALVDSNQTYDYKPGFQYLEEYIKQADISVANLEVTLAGPPFKGYPQFSSPDAYARNMKELGFDILVTANNHSQDRGKKGLIRTVRILDSIGIDHTGTFQDTTEFERNYPLIKTIKGTRIAFLNFTYGTNGLRVKHPTMVNMLDSQHIIQAIEKAKKRNADLIIPIVHWGTEYQRHENRVQRRWAQFLADQGCDAIIGMHPHVVQPIKMIQNKEGKSIPVAYSLGNFVSNQRDRYKDGGILFRLKFLKRGNQIVFSDYDYKPFWVNKLLPHELYPPFTKRGYYLIPPSKIDIMNEASKTKAAQFYDDTYQLLGKKKAWSNP